MKKLIYIFLFALIASGNVAAQSTSGNMMINTEAHIDSTGNAVFQMSGQLTAQQWITWNYMYGGGNAANVKRNIERSLSPYYVYDFKYMPNEMDRSFVIQYKAKGIVEYLGKDKWVASVGLRDAQPMKLTENSFNCVLSQMGGNNVIIQNSMKVTLPVAASNMEFDRDEFNNVLVKYKMPTESITTLGNAKMKTTGYSLLALGGLSLLTIIAFRRKIG